MFVWLAIWTAGCVFLVISEAPVLLALAFCVLWFVGLGALLHVMFGETQFILNGNGLETIYTCFFIKRVKRFELADIRQFESCADFEGDDPKRPPFLRVVLQRTFASYCASANEGELADVCKQLNAFLEMLKEPNI